MNWADYTIITVIGISVAISIWRGFTKEAFSLAGWIIAIWVAFTFADKLEAFLVPHIDVPSLRIATAFAILFFITILLAALVNYLAVQLVKKTGLSGTDRMIGIFFGIARGSMVVLVLIILAGLTAFPNDPWWKESVFIHYFQDMAVWTRQFLPADLADNIRY